MVKRAVVLLATLTLSVMFAPGRAGATPPTECLGTLDGGRFENVVVPVGASCVLDNSTVEGDVRVLENGLLQAHNNKIGGHVVATRADGVRLRDNKIGGNVHIVGGGPAASPFPTNPEFLVCGARMPSGSIIIDGVTGGVGVRYFETAAAQEKCSGPNRLDNGDIVIQDSNITRLLRVHHNKVARGDVRISNNRMFGLRSWMTNNQVGEGNFFVENNTGNSEKYVTHNKVAGLLMCERNDPPFVGGPNSSDRVLGQCSSSAP